MWSSEVENSLQVRARFAINYNGVFMLGADSRCLIVAPPVKISSDRDEAFTPCDAVSKVTKMLNSDQFTEAQSLILAIQTKAHIEGELH